MVTEIANKLAALALTVVLSATCILGAVAPATATGGLAVASAARFVA